MLAPLIPFTAEEVYSSLPGNKEISVHLVTLKDVKPWHNADLVSQWVQLLKIRDEALKLLETMRKDGAIGAPLDAQLDFGLASLSRGYWYQFIQRRLDDLKDLLIVSRAGWLDDDSINRLPSAVRAGAQHESPVDGKYFWACSVSPPSTDAAMETLSADLIIVGRHASGAKCARCWKYFDNSGGETLDARCRAVVGA
jgi:isoleucyl-tRNA synthetase